LEALDRLHGLSTNDSREFLVLSRLEGSILDLGVDLAHSAIRVRLGLVSVRINCHGDGEEFFFSNLGAVEMLELALVSNSDLESHRIFGVCHTVGTVPFHVISLGHAFHREFASRAFSLEALDRLHGLSTDDGREFTLLSSFKDTILDLRVDLASRTSRLNLRAGGLHDDREFASISLSVEHVVGDTFESGILFAVLRSSSDHLSRVIVVSHEGRLRSALKGEFLSRAMFRNFLDNGVLLGSIHSSEGGNGVHGSLSSLDVVDFLDSGSEHALRFGSYVLVDSNAEALLVSKFTAFLGCSRAP
jgi:hypothetical protein